MKSNKGAVTLYVIITMLTISAFLMAILIRNANAEKIQTETTARIKDTYENYDFNEVYETLKNNKSAISGYSITNDILTIETAKSNNVHVDQTGKKIVYFAVTTTETEPTEIGSRIGKWQNSNVIDISDVEVRESIYLWTKNEDNIVSYSHIIDTIEIGKIYGNSIEQETADSTIEVASVGENTVNLLPFPYKIGTQTTNGIEITVNDDGSIKINGTSTAGVTVYLYQNVTNLFPGLKTGDTITISKNADKDEHSSIYFVCNYYDATPTMKTGAQATAWTTGKAKITEDWKGLAVYLHIPTNQTIDNVTIKPMIQKGSEATEYEPYGKYKIPIRVRNLNNIFPIEDFSGRVAWTASTADFPIVHVSVEPNTLYYFSWEYSKRDNVDTGTVVMYISTDESISTTFASGPILASGTSEATNKYITFNSGNNTDLYFLIRNNQGKVTNVEITNMMLTKTRLTTFEPYFSDKVYNIFLDEPLRKVGEDADCIDLKNGKVVRKIEKIDSDGVETWDNYTISPREESIDLSGEAIFTTAEKERITIDTTVQPSDIEFHYK